jgi:hypothetical protein
VATAAPRLVVHSAKVEAAGVLLLVERVALRIRLPDRKLSADIAAKSLREAQAAIREAGADAIALVLRGRLVEGDVIAEAGLSAQPKAKHGSDAANGN